MKNKRKINIVIPKTNKEQKKSTESLSADNTRPTISNVSDIEFNIHKFKTSPKPKIKIYNNKSMFPVLCEIIKLYKQSKRINN